MAQVKVILSQHDNKSYTLNKSKIQEGFPESLFGLALEQDSKATEIIIQERVVTPFVMELVLSLIDRTYVSLQVCAYNYGLDHKKLDTLIDASRYLLIPELKLFSTPSIDLHAFQNANLGWLNMNMIPDNYKQFLTAAYQEKYEEYFEYLLMYHYQDHPVLNTLFFQAILDDQLWYMQALIQKGKIDPVTAVIDRQIQSREYTKQYRSVFGHTMHIINEASHALYYATGMGHYDMVRWLLTYTKVADPNGACLTINNDRHGVKILLMEHIQYDDEYLEEYWEAQFEEEDDSSDDEDSSDEPKEVWDPTPEGYAKLTLSTMLLTQEKGSLAVSEILQNHRVSFSAKYRGALALNPETVVPAHLMPLLAPSIISAIIP